MSSLAFTRSEVAAALARGVRQCVLLGSRPVLRDLLPCASDRTAEELALQVFAIEKPHSSDVPADLFPTDFASEPLSTALKQSGFDAVKATLFVWLGDAGYRTVDAVLTSLAFIASLPKGSGVVLDYVAEYSSLGSLTHTALDALSSRVAKGGVVTQITQPEAVSALLRALGFQKIIEAAPEDWSATGERLISATV